MGRFFEPELLEQIRNANDIVSVISESVVLKKKGKTYWGCCPFHNEKTPSFSVNADKGLFHCFGCKAGGNVFNYIQRYENITFPEAVEKLAARANISLPEEKSDPAKVAQKRQQEKIYEVNELAATFFHNCLTKTKLGQAGYEYLRNRQLSDESITQFRLGFAPNSWDKLYKSFKARGIDDRLLLEAGLIRKGKNGYYDYFRNRVMFPICDGRGRVVGFGGRVMDDSTPKYLNSSESDLFNKGHLLFAFDKAHRAIREKKQAILMEGYMDVIAAHNQGITNVVASLGTAFTIDQSRLLARQAQELVLAYDMDGAGRMAAKRAIELLQNQEFKVKILSMPDGKDPDEFIKKHGPDAFLTLVAEAVPAFEFLLNEALMEYDSDTLEGKIAILTAVFPYIAQAKSVAKQDGYLKALALPLWLDNKTVYRYFKEFKVKKGIQMPQKEMALKPEVGENTNEDTLMAMAFSNAEALRQVQLYIPVAEFNNPLYPTMMQKAMQVVEEGTPLIVTALEEVFSEEEKTLLYRIMVLAGSWDERAFISQLHCVRLESLRKAYKHHSKLADTLNRADDPRFIEELKECQRIQREIQQWSRGL